VIAFECPSAMSMNCCAVTRLAVSHSFSTRGRCSTLSIRCCASSRSALAAGPASDCSRGGSAFATSLVTSTFA